MQRIRSSTGGALALVEAAAMVFAAPLLLFPGRWSADALAVLPCLWLIRLILMRTKLRRTPADWPVLVLLLMLSVSLYPSVDLSLSQPKLYGLLLGLYVFAALIQWLQFPFWRRVAPAGLVLSGVGVALGGLVGTNWNPGKLNALGAIYARLPHFLTAVPTSFGVEKGGINPNELGGTLTLVLPVALGMLLFAQSWRTRLTLAVPAALMTGTLLLTFSRSALLGLAAGLWLLLGLRWGVRAALLLAGVAVGIAAPALAVSGGLDRLLPTSDAASESLQWRIDVWRLAFLMIQDFPFTGIGLNTFPLVADRLYPLFIPHTIERIPHAHNLFLQTGVDLGIPGLTAFLALATRAARHLSQSWRSARDGWDRSLVAGAGAGLVSHLVFGLTDAIALGAKPSVLLWVLLAVAMSVQTGAPIGLVGKDAEGELEQSGPETSSDVAGNTGATVVHWLQWLFFSLACGLGLVTSALGPAMLPNFL